MRSSLTVGGVKSQGGIDDLIGRRGFSLGTYFRCDLRERSKGLGLVMVEE